VFEYGPSEDGDHFYGGWFYFVGQMVTAGERNSNVPDSDYFTFWFSANCPDAPAFHGGPVLAIEFTTRVKSVLPDAPQYGTTSGGRSEQE
jgi:hypothetical protein